MILPIANVNQRHDCFYVILVRQVCDMRGMNKNRAKFLLATLSNNIMVASIIILGIGAKNENLQSHSRVHTTVRSTHIVLIIKQYFIVEFGKRNQERSFLLWATEKIAMNVGRDDKRSEENIARFRIRWIGVFIILTHACLRSPTTVVIPNHVSASRRIRRRSLPR